MARQSKVEFYEQEDGGEQPWRWRVRARNGEIVASGESHASEAKAVQAFNAAARAIWEAHDAHTGMIDEPEAEGAGDA